MSDQERHELSERTRELIELLLNAPWFENVGRPLDAPHAAERVGSMDEAIRSFMSDHWEDVLQVDARNGLSGTLYEQAWERFQQWNEINRAISEYHDRFQAVYERLSRDHGLPPEGWIRFRNSLAFACMESEYIDVLPLGFYSELASWYLDGYFPCGMRGEYPDGVLLVH